MRTALLLPAGPVQAVDYVCTATPHSVPFVELHHEYSLSFVRRGSFGCHTRGRRFELVAGSVLVGRPGDEFLCTHEHHAGGDECLSFRFSAECLDALGVRVEAMLSRGLPPLPELMVLGELAQAVVDGASDAGLDEVGLCFGARFAQMTSARALPKMSVSERDRKRAVDVAHWLSSSFQEPVDWEHVAGVVGLSRFHFLRSFAKVLGVTPHQYLVRARLRSAARLLAERELSVTEVALAVGFEDLSHFIRTFRRAAGVSPSAFRLAARGERNILQARINAPLETD